MNLSHPRKMWIKLQDFYESKSINMRLTLNFQLYSLKMGENSTIKEHLRSVSDIKCQLANIGVQVLDEELVDRILTSLLSSWVVFRQMLASREHPFIHVEFKSHLLQKDFVHTCNRE